MPDKIFTVTIAIDAPCPPDIPDIRRALVQYFSSARVTVKDAGEKLAELERANALDSAISKLENVNELTAKVERLREALKSFADAVPHTSRLPDSVGVWYASANGEIVSQVTLGHLRAAANAMKETE